MTLVACGEPQGGDSDGGTDAQPESSDGVDEDGPPTCTDAEIAAAEEELRALAGGASGCFSGWVETDDGFVAEIDFHASYNSFSWWLETCCVHPWTTWDEPRRLERSVRAAVHGWTPPCPYLMVFVAGGAHAEAIRIGEAIERACEIPWDAYFVIEIDTEGRVSDVYGDASAADLVACIVGVLGDEVFPCLATTQLCPEYVITE